MKLYIRNMVCSRCIMVVKAELEKTGIQPLHIELGEVELKKELSPKQLQQFSHTIKQLGFELIDDRKSKIIDKIKTIIIELVHHNKEELNENLSAHLSAKLHHDYSYLSNLFSEVEGTTIEKYYIAQKIEKVKELLMYDELSLSQIAFDLGYSSVAHLSSQFKKQTGLTPTFFKSLKENKRRNIEEL
ncbi:MAG: helix-turn-helix domain-containing protein [Chitinophagaceae bacterium]|jgi:AraC-like DNA-binding protein|nr:helix-turn-helix domain-containing protein [Chitinophagaceae bacterium]